MWTHLSAFLCGLAWSALAFSQTAPPGGPIQVFAPPANGGYIRTVYTGKVAATAFLAGNGPVVAGAYAVNVEGSTLFGGVSLFRPWDSLAKSCIRNGLIEDVTFIGCGTQGADNGVIMIPRQLTGWLTIRNCTFIRCKSVCIYFDDLASGIYGPILIENCTFIDCEQAVLIGGGKGFTIRNLIEYRSQKASVIDNRAQVDRSSPRSCKWVEPSFPGAPYASPWEQAKYEFSQMGLPVDIPAFAKAFNTGGTIENWRVFDGPPVQFLDGAQAFWTVR